MEFIINDGALEKCMTDDDETEIIIPEGIKVIGSDCFMSQKNIISVIIPDGVEKIDECAFCNCFNLENIIIPESVQHICANAFSNTEWLKKRFMERPFAIVNNILVEADFWYKGDIKIPDGVEVIADCAFSECHEVTSIEIPESVRRIGKFAFDSCTSLENIIIPDTVEKIKHSIFYENFNLKNFIVKGNYINIRICVEYNKMYKENFPMFISAKGEKKELVFSMMKSDSYKIPCALIMLCKYDNEIAEKYIKENIKKVVKYIITESDARCLTRVLNFIGAGDIDRLIKYAIEQKKPELQVILSNYKNDNFGFDADFEKYKL